VPFYRQNLMLTSKIDRRLQRRNLLVIMKVLLEATFNFRVVAEDMV
jgi:hypothetical protein